MNVFINGESIAIQTSENKVAVVECALMKFLTTDQQQRTFAVALNSDFVGRGDYAKTLIQAGDSLDVLFPIQGG